MLYHRSKKLKKFKFKLNFVNIITFKFKKKKERKSNFQTMVIEMILQLPKWNYANLDQWILGTIKLKACLWLWLLQSLKITSKYQSDITNWTHSIDHLDMNRSIKWWWNNLIKRLLEKFFRKISLAWMK